MKPSTNFLAISGSAHPRFQSKYIRNKMQMMSQEEHCLLTTFTLWFLVRCMQHFIVLDLEIEKTLQLSKELESKLNGDWVYFDASDGTHGRGLFKLTLEHTGKVQDTNFRAHFLEAHDDFLNHVLGLFTPSTETQVSIHKSTNFKDFCVKLNELLIQEKKIYDLSRKNFWIWHEPLNEKAFILGDKLKCFLELI